MESSCLVCFPYSFAEGVVERFEALTVLERKEIPMEGCTVGNSFEGVTTLLSEDFLRYRDAASAMTRYRGEIPSLQANKSGTPATSSNYYVDVDGKADWEFPDLHAAEEPLEHTLLETKHTELQEAYRRIDFVLSSSILDEVYFSFGCITAPGAKHTSSNDTLRHNTEGASYR